MNNFIVVSAQLC